MAPTLQVQSQEPINVKLLLIGNSSVGKSSLLLRFSDKQWLPEDEVSATIEVDFRLCSVFLDSLIIIFDDNVRCDYVRSFFHCRVLWDDYLRQVHKLEVRRKVILWVCHWLFFTQSERTDAEMPFFLRLHRWFYIVGHCRPKTFPHNHSIVSPWCVGHHTRYECSPRHASPFLIHRDLGPCVRMRIIVYDVSNQESFEALLR